jgi:hypothetical protein
MKDFEQDLSAYIWLTFRLLRTKSTRPNPPTPRVTTTSKSSSFISATDGSIGSSDSEHSKLKNKSLSS